MRWLEMKERKNGWRPRSDSLTVGLMSLIYASSINLKNAIRAAVAVRGPLVAVETQILWAVPFDAIEVKYLEDRLVDSHISIDSSL